MPTDDLPRDDASPDDDRGRGDVPADPELSAQVVLIPAGGPTDTPVTAETLAEHAPDTDAAAHVASHLRRAGFDVGELIGTSFSITGPRSRFEDTFDIALTIDTDDAGTVAYATTDAGHLELPLSSLPSNLVRHVTAVTFTEPPDFGPGSFA